MQICMLIMRRREYMYNICKLKNSQIWKTKMLEKVELVTILRQDYVLNSIITHILSSYYIFNII